MQKILKVAQREYIETVKTKTFIFMILMYGKRPSLREVGRWLKQA